MLKAVIIPIVLLLAAGPSPALLCQAWCDPMEAAENGCHWPESDDAARVAAVAGCATPSPAESGFIAESVRSGMDSAAECPPDLLADLVAPSANGPRIVADRSPTSAADRRPLDTSLRI